MEKSIALARVPRATGAAVQVDVRGKLLNARVVKAPVRASRQDPRQLSPILTEHISMSNIPADLKYTKSHEWVRTLADGNVEVGITDHAQGALGDLVFVEVPEAGKALKAGDAFAVVESVKAASDVYAPDRGRGDRRQRRARQPARADQFRAVRRAAGSRGSSRMARRRACCRAAEYQAHLAAEG